VFRLLGQQSTGRGSVSIRGVLRLMSSNRAKATFGSGSKLTISTAERGWLDWPILVAALVLFLMVGTVLLGLKQ
jgi:hypothetical protein